MYIQKNLAYLKEKNEYSYQEISKYTGLNVNTLYSIVVGSYKNITITTVIKLTQFFSISIDDFVYKDLSKKWRD
ncbi:helix-turn-helix transcriptional regulator [[Clostridium] innocuum]|nr:helix-turn-helix transcriptional regulator [[Clostridium] innocuum]